MEGNEWIRVSIDIGRRATTHTTRRRAVDDEAVERPLALLSFIRSFLLLTDTTAKGRTTWPR